MNRDPAGINEPLGINGDSPVSHMKIDKKTLSPQDPLWLFSWFGYCTCVLKKWTLLEDSKPGVGSCKPGTN